MTLYACSTNKYSIVESQSNKSYYHIQSYQNKMRDSAVVVGFMSNMLGETLPCFVIMVDGRFSHKAECDGEVIISLVPGSYNFTAFWIGYDSVKTKQIEITRKDSIRIHFYLEPEVSLHVK